MENYLMLNGKRIDLTAEQIETLVGKKEKDPFERAEYCNVYFYVDSDGNVEKAVDYFTMYDNDRYDAGNYCTDEELMKQIALHETLNRRLRRYSMQHGGRGLDFKAGGWEVLYDTNDDWYVDDFLGVRRANDTLFVDERTAAAAIEEIVKPFMEKHPEFRW